MNSENLKYYRELSIQPNASQEEVRDAYRRLAKQYHPDLNRGDPKAEERFKRINEAYHKLMDPKSRIHTQTTSAAKSRTHEESKRRAKSDDQKAKSESASSFSDFFKKVFKTEEEPDRPSIKRNSHPKAPSLGKGRDLQINLELDAIEMATGIKKTVLLTRERTCHVCDGSGLQPGCQPITCKICLGIGEIPRSQGGQTVFVTCPNCRGSGKIIRDRCLNCGGEGIAPGKSQVTINVPEGTKPGQILTIVGLGDAGRNGGTDGDLHVNISEKENPYFQAQGYDLVCDYPLNLLEIMQGGEIEVPSPRGHIKLTLNPRLEHNKMLRVNGKGLPKPDGGYGDLIIRIRHHFPEKVSKKALDLIQQLVELPGWKPKRDKKV